MKKYLFAFPLCLSAGFCLLIGGPVSAQIKAPADSTAIETPADKGLPVIFRQDTLFYLHYAPSNITLAERTELVEERVAHLEEDPLFNGDSLVVVQKDSVFRLIYKGDVVLTVSPGDAGWSDLSPGDLAAGDARAIKDALGKVAGLGDFKTIGVFIAEAFAVVGALLVLIWLVNRLFRFLKTRWIGHKQYPPVLLGKYEMLTASQIRDWLVRFLSITRWVVILLLVYLSLPLIFGIFPWTKPIAEQLFEYVLAPVRAIVRDLVEFIPNLFTIAIVFVVTRYADRMVRYFASEVQRGQLLIPGFYADWAKPTYKIVKALLYVFMFIIIFPYLPGSQSKVFQGVSVFLGVLFSLGSSSAIANVVAGIVITYMRPYKIGDVVKIGEVMGAVVEKTLLVTRIRTIKNEEITIPNATILGGGTTNYTAFAEAGGLILHTTVTIGYDAPWKTVHELLIRAAGNTGGLLTEPGPFVLQTGLEDFYVSYQLNVYTKEPARMAGIYSDLHTHIQDAFNEAGVEIMSPHYAALRDGNAVTIPR
jgi:small-conductance mechanosensitive channel